MLSIVSPLLTILNQIKIYHWQTNSFSEHKAFNMAYKRLEESIDEFIEVYQGIFGRVKAASGSFLLELENLQTANLPTEEVPESQNLQEKIDQWIAYLKSFNNDADLNDKSDLLNIRDEMLGTLNQLKYLITLD
jgi:DNA-binding ferritin-like protein